MISIYYIVVGVSGIVIYFIDKTPQIYNAPDDVSQIPREVCNFKINVFVTDQSVFHGELFCLQEELFRELTSLLFRPFHFVLTRAI